MGTSPGGARGRPGVQPDVLLPNEPLGALDKNLREQMQVELGKRWDDRLAALHVYVTTLKRRR